jgi:hypothetical protein
LTIFEFWTINRLVVGVFPQGRWLHETALLAVPTTQKSRKTVKRFKFGKRLGLTIFGPKYVDSGDDINGLIKHVMARGDLVLVYVSAFCQNMGSFGSVVRPNGPSEW